MNKKEEEFNASVRGMLASLRFDEKVNVKVVESVEGFCKWVRDEDKIFTPETKR